MFVTGASAFAFILVCCVSDAQQFDNTTCGAGKLSCGLQTCCSGSGYCGVGTPYCGSGCQSTHGKCAVVNPPSPSSGSCSGATVGGRTVGYYQSAGATRRCDAVPISKIVTTGLTHINYAFLALDPANCGVVASAPADYAAFTALKKSGLQTWISVGGAGDGSVDVAKQWQTIASTKTCRLSFSSNLAAFVKQYGFQGADIDWETPVYNTDTQNMVTLMMDIWNSFGSGNTYGVSVYLPADFGTLIRLNPTGMQKYVNWFNVGTYDLNSALNPPRPGYGVDAQTNLTEIDPDLTPLWYAGVSPAKVNLGLAYYGRSYKLTSASCSSPGCPWKAGTPGDKGYCTSDPSGAISNQEIQDTIKAKGGSPTLYSSAGVKGLVYNTTSLVFYDDAQTFTLKRNYANSRCLGGTMIYALDLWNVGKQ